MLLPFARCGGMLIVRRFTFIFNKNSRIWTKSAYRPRLVQKLNDDDPDRRIEFCETMLIMIEKNNSILDKIIWTDEAIFKLNGHVNRHNSLYLTSENPQIDIERDFSVAGVYVWIGLSSYAIIGPFFFNSTVAGESYAEMLQDYSHSEVID